MVIREARHAGAEHDVAGPLGGGGDEDLGGADRLPARGVMLAHPHLVVTQVIHPLDELHVAVHRERGVLADPVEGREEDAELEAAMGHVVSFERVFTEASTSYAVDPQPPPMRWSEPTWLRFAGVSPRPDSRCRRRWAVPSPWRSIAARTWCSRSTATTGATSERLSSPAWVRPRRSSPVGARRCWRSAGTPPSSTRPT